MRTLAAPDFDTLHRWLPAEIERHQSNDPLRTVTVVTPGDLAREETRRQLARRSGGILAVTVVAFGDWIRSLVADEIGRQGGSELGDAGLGRLVSRAYWTRPNVARAAPARSGTPPARRGSTAP